LRARSSAALALVVDCSGEGGGVGVGDAEAGGASLASASASPNGAAPASGGASSLSSRSALPSVRPAVCKLRSCKRRRLWLFCRRHERALAFTALRRECARPVSGASPRVARLPAFSSALGSSWAILEGQIAIVLEHSLVPGRSR
jgi:hypothetical protein